MPKAVSDLTDVELQNVIDNYRRKKLTSEPYYLSALEEMGRRKGDGLDFNKTLRAVLKAAREGHFLSYGQLAEESGLEWPKVRRAMGDHLGDLAEYSRRMDWPLLTAIVVNKQNLETGNMEPSALRGFLNAAAALDYVITDEKEFLRKCQRNVFEWAKSYKEV